MIECPRKVQLLCGKACKTLEVLLAVKEPHKRGRLLAKASKRLCTVIGFMVWSSWLKAWHGHQKSTRQKRVPIWRRKWKSSPSGKLLSETSIRLLAYWHDEGFQHYSCIFVQKLVFLLQCERRLSRLVALRLIPCGLKEALYQATLPDSQGRLSLLWFVSFVKWL